MHKKTGTVSPRYAGVVVALAGALVFADTLLSSQVIGLSYTRFSWQSLAGVYEMCSLGEAVDAPQWTWTTGGASSWAGRNGIGYDGIDAAQSGLIVEDQQSWCEATVSGPCKITYMLKVSSELHYDFLRFYVDGVEQPGSQSGEVSWQQAVSYVDRGLHTLRWAYTKDESVSLGADAAWVDQVQIIPGSDADGDGISDAWEWRQFGSLDTATTNSDWDHDGFLDVSESYAGTDPMSKQSLLRLDSAAPLSTTGFVVRWSSVTGIVYRLDYTTNLLQGFSTQLDNILSTPPENAYTDNVTGGPVKFYRVAVPSPP